MLSRQGGTRPFLQRLPRAGRAVTPDAAPAWHDTASDRPTRTADVVDIHRVADINTEVAMFIFAILRSNMIVFC